MPSRKESLEIAAELEALASIGKKYTLIGPRVALLRDETPDKVGKIFIPDAHKEKLLSGTIVMLGNGLTATEQNREQFAGLKVGQWATFNKYNGVVHSIYLPGTDRKVAIEVLHALDVYIVWEGEDEESPFEEADHTVATFDGDVSSGRPLQPALIYDGKTIVQ